MKHNKYIYWVIEVLIFSAVFLLAYTIFSDEYLFGWATHNWKLYLILSIIPLLLLFFKKQLVSVFMGTGIVVGLFIGNYLGDLIRKLNMEKVVEGMTNQEIARLHHDPGFSIWIVIILLSIIIGVIVQTIISKRRVNI